MSAQTLSRATKGPRTQGKHDAVRDFKAVPLSDVDALIDNAQESYHASTGDSRRYWLSYWGRLIELRRQHYQKRHAIGRYTTA